MSAIWGEFSLEKINDGSKADIMKNQFEQRYSFDALFSESIDYASFGMAMQYLFNGAEDEDIRLDKTNRMIALDGYFDNKDELIEQLNLRDNVTNVCIVNEIIEKFGINGFDRCRGSFSAAIYDCKHENVYLVSDAVASRCLYYYYDNDKLLFSTTIEPLLLVMDSVEKNEMYIRDYLLAPGLMPNVNPVETLYKNIFKIPSGTYLKINKNGIEKVKYFHLDNMPKYKLKKASQWGEEFANLFEKCVCDILHHNNKETGIALSSGLDSASVAGKASKFLKKKGEFLYSYTYVPFEKDVKKTQWNDVVDETEDVRKIVSMHQNIIPHFLTNEGRNCVEKLEKTLEIEEIPIKAVVNFPSLCEVYECAAKDGCGTVLVGQMGNSTISNGYIDDILFDLWKNKKFFTFAKWLNNYSKTVKESRKAAFIGCFRYFRHSQKVLKGDFEFEVDNQYLNPDIAKDYPAKERYLQAGIEIFQRIPGFGEMYHKDIMREGMLTYLGEFETKMGLEYKVIVRDPTRDIRMISFCCQMPYRFFANKGVPRWLVRGNLRDEIPNELLDDWMRYGLQNGDFIQRIRRDADFVFDKIRKILNYDEIQMYIDYEKVCADLDNRDNFNDMQLEDITVQLLYLCEIALFLRKINN